MIDETAAEIERMATHSSSAVAVKATRALSELLDREYVSLEEFERDLERNAGVLRRANPSHASLHNALREVEGSVIGSAVGVEGAKGLLRETIDRVAGDVRRRKRGAAAAAAETLDGDDAILTHDYSETVLGAVEAVVSDGAELDVYVTESRPRFLGRKTARALAGVDGVEPRLLVDSAMGHALREVDRVALGMTCLVGSTYYNRVGTLPIAATAAEFGVPVAAVGSSAKIAHGGFAFENDHRPQSEVTLEPLDGVAVENPAYDAVPLSLVGSVITEDGELDPQEGA